MADRLFCPTCLRDDFKSLQGLTRHINSMLGCSIGLESRKQQQRAQMSSGIPFNRSDSPTSISPSSNSNCQNDEEQLEAERHDMHELIDEWDKVDGDAFHFVDRAQDVEDEDMVEIGVPGQEKSHPHPQTKKFRVHVLDEDDDTRFEVTNESAGKVIKMDASVHAKWQALFGNDNMDVDQPPSTASSNAGNIYSPFASELDWRVARWAVKDGIGHNSLDRLLAIPGVTEKLGLSFHNIRSLHQTVDLIPDRAGEWKTDNLKFDDFPDLIYTVRYRDPIEAIRSLWGDPELSHHIVYKPKKVFSDATQSNRIFTEMWTGKWWHAVQKALPPGATVGAVNIATDKTKLTEFSGGQCAYPVYLTLGNIPKALRRKPSKQACVLIAYLPVETDLLKGTNLNKQNVGSRHQRLFHDAMRHILTPLIDAGTHGVYMTGGNGEVRRVFPILASYAADFPEQCLIACAKYGTCPKCQTGAKFLNKSAPNEARTNDWTLNVMQSAEESSENVGQYYKSCMAEEVSGSVYEPFWKGFPFSNIHLALTPDVLHQLYQGVIATLIDWCQTLLTAKELDARIRALPPACGVRHFKNGFSILSQISGPERKHMARILLGCLIGKVEGGLLSAFRSLLDFLYLAQYKAHDDETLGYMEDALHNWHNHKHLVIESGLHPDLNIPKFHSLLHYVQAIRMFGTTDNYNTETFERFHIDFAKEGWRASNKRDAFPQMINWLSRREKMSMFDHHVNPTNQETEKIPSVSLTQPRSLLIAKYPPLPRKHVSAIEERHNAPHFSKHLKEFLNSFLQNPTTDKTSQLYPLPFDRLDVWTQFKFQKTLQDDPNSEIPQMDTVKAVPQHAAQRHGQFDTVVAIRSNEAQSTGVEGTQIGRIRIIFKLPDVLTAGNGLQANAPTVWPKTLLAYIEWYQPLLANPDKHHGMFTVRKQTSHSPQFSIVPITNIRQSCMLIPNFGGGSPKKEWKTDTVLDLAQSFFLNNWQSLYAYQSLW